MFDCEGIVFPCFRKAWLWFPGAGWMCWFCWWAALSEQYRGCAWVEWLVVFALELTIDWGKRDEE